MSQRTRSGTIPNPTALFGTLLFQPTDPSELHFPSGHCISDSPWLLSPLLVAAFWSPNLSPEGHGYLLTSHTFGRGWGSCVLSGWNYDSATTTKREKKPLS